MGCSASTFILTVRGCRCFVMSFRKSCLCRLCWVLWDMRHRSCMLCLYVVAWGSPYCPANFLFTNLCTPLRSHAVNRRGKRHRYIYSRTLSRILRTSSAYVPGSASSPRTCLPLLPLKHLKLNVSGQRGECIDRQSMLGRSCTPWHIYMYVP